MSDCPRCQQRVKDWQGSDPKCAFSDGVFSPDNWNCATMNVLRDMATNVVYSEDSNAAILSIGEGRFILLSWYKRRGCTALARLIDLGMVQPLALCEVEEFLQGNK